MIFLLSFNTKKTNRIEFRWRANSRSFFWPRCRSDGFLVTMRLYSDTHRPTTSLSALDAPALDRRRSIPTASLMLPRKSRGDGDCFWAETCWMPGSGESRAMVVVLGITYLVLKDASSNLKTMKFQFCFEKAFETSGGEHGDNGEQGSQRR